MPFSRTVLQYYLYVWPDKGHESDFVDSFLPTGTMMLYLVAVGRGRCPIWWSAVVSLLASAALFGLLWVYAGILPAVPTYATSPYMPAIIFPLVVPGAAGLVLRYVMEYFVPIASMQVVVCWRRRRYGWPGEARKDIIMARRAVGRVLFGF